MGNVRENLARLRPCSGTSKVWPRLEPLPVKHNPYLHDLVWTLLKPHPAGKLLDIPAGPGYFAQQAQANGFQAVAAEIDQSLHIFPEVSYQTVDMSKELPFPINSFDYIVSIEGIEHIENQFLFIRECNRILKRGGKFFLTTPNSSSLESRLLFFITGVHDNPPRPIRGDLSNIFMEHINLIPFHRLETFLRLAGFQIETHTTYRMRKGSLFLYPLVYPFAYLRYLVTYRKKFKGKPDEQFYWSLMKRYLSREVMCGSHAVIVALKK